MVRFTLDQLEKKSKNRPQGYKEEILSLSKRIDENFYELDEENFKKLAEKYRTPSLVELISNLTNASIELFKKGYQTRTPEEIEKAIKTCISCSFFIEGQTRCGKCGCFLKMKVLKKNWKCPINKWD